MNTSFCHIINPFPAKKDSEHDIASRITYESLRIAVNRANENKIPTELKAIILKGDEASIQMPATLGAYLDRTVQDIKQLLPKRPLPLIADILSLGEKISSSSHIIFSNMDIAVQPDFYTELRKIIEDVYTVDTPFIVYRRNISNFYTDEKQIFSMYQAPGEIAYGFDCFVIPRQLISKIDLGDCCIGAAHFDYLLFMALDAASDFQIKRVSEPALTFHIGNQIEWSTNIDYIEHNLNESIKSIDRMSKSFQIKSGSDFERLEKLHFRPNNRFDSKMLRKLKRISIINRVLFKLKRQTGRGH